MKILSSTCQQFSQEGNGEAEVRTGGKQGGWAAGVMRLAMTRKEGTGSGLEGAGKLGRKKLIFMFSFPRPGS